MNHNIEYIINYAEGQLSEEKMKEFESDLRTNKELEQQYIVYRQIREFMRAKFDLEDVRNDPALQEAESVVKQSISEYQGNQDNNKGTQRFIKDALDKKISGKAIQEEITQIKQEIHENNINKISEAWVSEWNEKNQHNNTKDPEIEKLRKYISQSMEPDAYSSELKIIHKAKFDFRKSAMIRFIGVAAAVMLAGVLLFKTLIHPEDPEQLYKVFYSPMDILSPVTRGDNSGLSIQYDKAIEMYSHGNYPQASSLLNDVIQKDPSFISPRFLMGVTQMELGNYGQAISQLSLVKDGSGEYVKEAQWYLGLSYLKTGETAKAIPCFEFLASSEGFYQDQAKKLLRHLK